MKNPLFKRLKREFVQDIAKYIIIFLFLVLPISLCSGYMIGNDSMIRTYDEAIEKYSLEDGHFQTIFALSENEISEINAKEDLTVSRLFYKEELSEKEHTIRIYDIADRENVNTVCLHKGELPAFADEIALDRLYCENNGVTVGDAFSVG